MSKYRPSDQDNESGAITMPTKGSLQQSGQIRKQDHPTRTPAEGYSSEDDAKASGYGKTTGKTPPDKSRRVTPRRSW